MQRHGAEDAMLCGRGATWQKVLEKRRGKKSHGLYVGHLEEQLFKPVSSQAQLEAPQNKLAELLGRTIGLY